MPQLKYTIQQGQLTPANAHCEAWTQAREGQTITVEPLSPAKIRSLECNAKYWSWIRQIADEQGYDNGYVHAWHKYYYGLPILAEENPDKYDMLRRWLGQLPLETRIKQMHLIICTSEFNQSQMNRFMEAVQRYWAKNGIFLD